MGISDLKPKSLQGNDNRPVFVALNRMIPNLVTLTAMAAGITAIQFAFTEKWDAAVIAILIAAILDTMDGAIARLLNAQSDFGAQLDSLSDFLSFGVAPAIILNVWILQESGKVGWMAMIVYAAAAALRRRARVAGIGHAVEHLNGARAFVVGRRRGRSAHRRVAA